MAIHRLAASRPYLPVVLFANDRVADAVALIDTGASITAVHPEIIGQLRPLKIGAVDVGRVGEAPQWAPTYYFTVRLGSESGGFGVEVVAAVPASPCEVLIGRDLLGRWVLSWDGTGDRLLISY
jgi:hypothetical protein